MRYLDNASALVDIIVIFSLFMSALVENLGDAGSLLARLGVPQADPVYIRPVQVIWNGVYGQFPQLSLAGEYKYQQKKCDCGGDRTVLMFAYSS